MTIANTSSKNRIDQFEFSSGSVVVDLYCNVHLVVCKSPSNFTQCQKNYLFLSINSNQQKQIQFFIIVCLFVCSRIILRKETGHPMTYIARSDDLLSSPRGLRTLTEGSAVGSGFFYTISSSPGISSLAACSRVEEAAVTSLIQLHSIRSTIKIHHVHFYQHLLLLAHLATKCAQHSLPSFSPAQTSDV